VHDRDLFLLSERQPPPGQLDRRAAAGLAAGTAIVSSAVATAAVTAPAVCDMTGRKALI
jgi:hypothetical protein